MLPGTLVDMLEGQAAWVDERGIEGAAGCYRRVFVTCRSNTISIFSRLTVARTEQSCVATGLRAYLSSTRKQTALSACHRARSLAKGSSLRLTKRVYKRFYKCFYKRIYKDVYEKEPPKTNTNMFSNVSFHS